MENHVEANIEEYKNIIFEDELSLKKSTNFKKKMGCAVITRPKIRYGYTS